MDSLLAKIDFGNEAADDISDEELISYFVEQDTFHKYTDPKNKLLIATARKGVGKSALLKWVAHKVSVNNPAALVIQCRGSDLVRSKFHLASPLTGPNDYINDWMIRICALVNRELALRLDVKFDDDHFSLVETAEIEGYKSRNIAGCLLDRLGSYVQKFLPDKITIKNEIETLRRVKDRKVWIIVDDLDATFQNTNPECMGTSTFFSACRYLTQDFQGINIRVSIRSEVWAIIRRYDESLDKMEQYVDEILWSLKDFRQLLFLRIITQMEKMPGLSLPKIIKESPGKIEEVIIGYIFVPTMTWGSGFFGNKTVPTYQILYTLSYERPRWAIQLCKLAQKSALKRGEAVIGRVNIDEVWGDYGTKRIADLVAEHKHQCNSIEELLTSFRGCERLLTKEELFQWITNHISNHMELNIEGKMTRHPRAIAHFLYRTGFILARSDDATGGYEHYHYNQMPDFLTSRQDSDFGVKWEIHPCYREALDIVKLNQSHRARFGSLRSRK